MIRADSVIEEIRLLVACGFDSPDSIAEQIIELMPEELGIPEDAVELDPRLYAALHERIAAGFARKTEDSRAWPEVTDCDRLRAAFDALERQGIVAREHWGLTLQEGIERMADLSLACDEADLPSHGYCFYHRQDTWSAARGDGLQLAFGELQDPPELSATMIGNAVVQACRDAGLDVAWDGSPDRRIELPGFCWQRRGRSVTEAELRELRESWELEVRAGYTPSDELATVIETRAADWLAGCAELGPALRGQLRQHAERFLEDERAREAGWSEPTTNDRISAAFAELGASGVLASECSGLTIQDGWGHAGTQASPGHRGALFFHHEDVIDGVEGRGMWLAYGALGVPASADDDATLALGLEIVGMLEAHGVACQWSQSVDDRIRVLPFEWRRRRWTSAPNHTRVSAPRPSPRRSGATRRGERTPPPSGRMLAVIVRTVQDERGFDLRRTRELRATWHARGHAGDVQVAHLGSPHVFVRTGEHTALMPQLALLNLREEKTDVFLRGQRAARAQDG